MKKNIIILCACSLMLAFASIGFADEEENEIYKRHVKWLNKIMAVHSGTAAKNIVQDGHNQCGKSHTVALRFWDNEGPSGKILRIGDFVLKLEKIYQAEQPYDTEDVYIYKFKGDPDELREAIEKIYCDNSPSGISCYELEGNMVVKVKSQEDLDYILAHYDVTLASPLWGTTDQFLLKAKDPGEAARIMDELEKQGLVEWAEFDYYMELIIWPGEPEPVEIEFGEVLERKSIGQKAQEKAGDPLFCERMADRQEKVIPLQTTR